LQRDVDVRIIPLEAKTCGSFRWSDSYNK
jgi:hypothetical protein